MVRSPAFNLKLPITPRLTRYSEMSFPNWWGPTVLFWQHSTMRARKRMPGLGFRAGLHRSCGEFLQCVVGPSMMQLSIFCLQIPAALAHVSMRSLLLRRREQQCASACCNQAHAGTPWLPAQNLILLAFEPLAAYYNIAYRMQANEISHLHPRNMQKKKEHLPGALWNLKIVALTSNHSVT